MEDRKTIRLRLVSKHPDRGVCLSYYQDEATGEFYALSTYQRARVWFTAPCDGGDPDQSLEDGLLIEIVADGQVISREVIKRHDYFIAAGEPVDEDGTILK